ncbi:DUF5686 family protein [Spongiimicrobium salis]|uniref:DUF5686 family protein n=1 Tax=Spongiimicrobium salis TaxID=1667022 RepID=UPI00374DB5FF
MKSAVIYNEKFYVLLLYLIIGQIASAQRQNPSEDVETKAIGVPNILFSGVLLQNEMQAWYFPNAFEWFPANTVEGFVVNPQVKFTQKYQDDRFFSIHPNIRYGFGNKRFQAQLKTQYYYKPKRNAFFSLSGGRAVEQLYEQSTLSALNNTLYTFAFRENFLKIYERSYVAMEHSFSPVKDFLWTLAIGWNKRNPLNNLARFEEDEDFTSNAPENSTLESTAFVQHKAVLFKTVLRWQLGHHLEKQRGQLISRGKYPAFTLIYTHATAAILGGDLSYQKLSFSIQDEFKVGQGYGRAFIEAGDFLKKDRLTFVDFKHFKGKETVYGTYDIDQFQLLEYYRNSTAEFYLQGHYEHQFGPLWELGKSRLKPLFGVHYLYTDAGGHYTELGVGMAGILKRWRIDLYHGWRQGDSQSFGVRVGLDMGQ